VGRRQRPLTPAKAQEPTEEETRLAAAAWAEFLYDEYCLEKQKRLTLGKKHVTVEKLTNHDKLNS
jgi:hypothetical protein